MAPAKLVVPSNCTVVAVPVATGQEVAAGTVVAIVEVMKIEQLITAPEDGVVTSLDAAVGDVLEKGAVIAEVTPATITAAAPVEDAGARGGIRPDLAEVLERRRLLEDGARPDAVAKVHGRGRRTARENLADLVDDGSFEEYGSFMYAAQTLRRSREDLIANTPGDGIVGGIGRINGDRFDDDHSRCAVMSYDYTVLAGTQGLRGHQKKDRLFDVCERLELPLVLFAEGGGGRPGDTDGSSLAGLNVPSFAAISRLSGLVPTVAVVSGRCFAGNAALAGVCDVIIATPDANLGMAGPAMIEGGGLGVFAPEDIGPVDVQTANGVIDILVEDDAAAVAAVKRYLAYFQGPVDEWDAADQTALRDVVPENRKRAYNVRDAISLLADTGSVQELRPTYAEGMITSLVRLEGRPVGIIANNPLHLGGAIDAPGSDKAARFMQLCDGHGIPILFLCDTPGFMVGPEAEKDAQVRRFGRMFVVGASLTVPFATVVLRKAVGLGAQAMAGGSFHAPLLTISWPTGEVSGMGIEGAVTLGARRELEAIEDPDERAEAYEARVATMYERSKALNAAAHHEFDDVIDPAETRRRIVNLLRAAPTGRPHRRRPHIDTW
ncbi:MAG: carboxyl transferase domain-containing protein [Acidimicrobiales bacterium]|nr:carboxyl transferase domain-containing protein [Acidimicrobiales bacterium]